MFLSHDAGRCQRVHSNATCTDTIFVVLHKVSPCVALGGCSVQQFS